MPSTNQGIPALSRHDSPIVSPDFVIERDSRGAVVHVRNRLSGECLGCIEVGLFEVLWALILEERKTSLTTDLAISAHQSDVCPHAGRSGTQKGRTTT